MTLHKLKRVQQQQQQLLLLLQVGVKLDRHVWVVVVEEGLCWGLNT